MNRKNYIIILITIFLFSLIIVTNCSKRGPQKEAPLVTIGIITPLSGEAADLGSEMLQSANIAIEKANEKYTTRFRLIARDDQMSAVTAATAAKALVEQENVIVILAAGNSPVARGQIEALKGKYIPIVTPSATASDLSLGLDYVFKVLPSNSAQARALADFAFKRNLKKAAIIFQQEDYSTDLKNAFKRLFKEIKGEILIEVGFEWEETDFRPQLNQIKKSEADVIMCFAQHVQVSRILVRARELGITLPILSGETAYTDKLLNATADSAEGLYVTGTPIAVESATPEMKAFIEEYKAKFGKRPGEYGIYTCDAVGLITSLIGEKNPKDGKELILLLQGIEVYNGITGAIRFDEQGEVIREYKIYTVKNGDFVQVE